MNEDESVSTWKFAVVALFAVIAFRIIWKSIFGQNGSSGSVAIAILSIALAAFWFARSVGRLPLSKERWSFFWQFTGMMVVMHIFGLSIIAVSSGLLSNGVMLVLINFSPYPLFAYLYFSERIMKGLVKQRIKEK